MELCFKEVDNLPKNALIIHKIFDTVNFSKQKEVRKVAMTRTIDPTKRRGIYQKCKIN